MPKARRILRSVRFKYGSLLKRTSTLSNCILLAVILFIIALVLSFSEHESNEDFYITKLDAFKSADYAKITYHSTQPGLTQSVKKIIFNTTKTMKPVSKSLQGTTKPWEENWTPKHLFPVIKMFYRDTSGLKRPKPTKIPTDAPKKLTYRDMFEAMAHPRVLHETTEYFVRADPEQPKTGLNDWIQANSPKDKSKLLVYSAYFDDRFEHQNIVRVMAVMVTKKPSSVYCRIQIEDDGTFVDVPVTIKIMNEHWRLKYASYFLSCEFSKKIPVPAKVLISRHRNFTFSAMLPVYNNKKNDVSPKGDLAVCVKPLHYYYNRATWMVEFVELHRILGVEHFYFYNHSVGEDMEILLRYYMKKNIVTVLPWNLPVRSQKEIRTEGIFSSLNDCVFRTMYLYHYVILLDFDEYIIPRDHNNYLDMIEQLEEDTKRIRGKPGSFVFRNTFFYLYWENDTSAYGIQPEKPPEEVPYLITQYKTRRLSLSMKVGSRSKYIVVPDRVVEVGNHVVWRHTSGSRAIHVPDTVALLHHYRICEFGGFSCMKKTSVVDRTANKFNSELLRTVFDQCHNIYPELKGKCPVSPPLGSPW